MRNKPLKALVKSYLLFLAALLLTVAASADTLQLKGKTTIIGKIVADKPDQVAVDIGYTVLLVPRSQILSISPRAPESYSSRSGAPAPRDPATGGATPLVPEAGAASQPGQPSVQLRAPHGGVATVRINGEGGSNAPPVEITLAPGTYTVTFTPEAGAGASPIVTAPTPGVTQPSPGAVAERFTPEPAPDSVEGLIAQCERRASQIREAARLNDAGVYFMTARSGDLEARAWGIWKAQHQTHFDSSPELRRAYIRLLFAIHSNMPVAL